ncbi:unnamed protein product [Somion occarium]|uniref:NFX1-type zinc finger-containing protein 1 n=1 Tax=Somion occarium TaxID=3059160 RepID=A0ABP1DH47_9APHY
MSARPCAFFNRPGGCRYGNNCRFLHPNSPSGSPGSRPVTKSPSPSGSSQSVPSGVCAFFWKSGNCNRGFQCRYKHERHASADSSSTASSTEDDPRTAIASHGGLARLADSATDALFSAVEKKKSPSEVHTALRRFFFDNYQFRNVLDMYAFVSLLSEATSNNATWTSEDGQLLLSAIARDNGLTRINDILTWTNVSIRAGSGHAILSFQRGYIPLLQYLSSDFVVKSALSHLTNALYMIVMENLENFTHHVRSCMDEIMRLKSFSDPNMLFSSTMRTLSGSQVFGSLATVLLQCLTRIKNAVATYSQLRPMVLALHAWLTEWIADVSAASTSFKDPITSTTAQARELICRHLNDMVVKLVSIADREHKKSQPREQQNKDFLSVSSGEGTLAALHNSYVGPGSLRLEGPRHDNDFIDINEIRLAPTHAELTSHIPPYLPANIYGAPHPHPSDSMERLLDIQFRLLREELTASLRASVQHVLDDLSSKQRKTQLDEIFKKRGGKYRGQSSDRDTVMFNVYTNLEFSAIGPDRNGLSVSSTIDSPPGRARSTQTRARVQFWESMGSKRLLPGGLVALVWKRDNGVHVHLGIIASSLRDHTESARQNSERISVRIGFFDPAVELRILQELQRPISERRGMKLLIEATVMFESVRPFLEALRVEPTSIPFGKYLVHRPPGELRTMRTDPPAYARVPGYTFELASLCSSETGIESLKLYPSDPDSIENARMTLRKDSRLDPSQADALVNALTHEVALIQGPPGTGKSYTGVEFLRVALANKAGPILMIAFTNHALDHMLTSVLDAKITTRIVRLGSRSSDERISQFSIEKLEEIAGRSRLAGAFSSNYRELKQIEEEIKKFMNQCLKPSVDSERIVRYLATSLPEFHEGFLEPPPWVVNLHMSNVRDNRGFTTVGARGQRFEADDSLYSFWLNGLDLEFLYHAHNPPTPVIQPSPIPAQAPATEQSTNMFAPIASMPELDPSDDTSPLDSASGTDSESDSVSNILDDLQPEEAWQMSSAYDLVEEDSENDKPSAPKLAPSAPLAPPSPSPTESITDSIESLGIAHFFENFGYTRIPLLPSSNHSLDNLLLRDDIWSMSLSERRRIHEHWVVEVRLFDQESNIQEFERLRTRHADALERYSEGRAAARSEVLRNVDIIGCTTTGAAKLTPLLKAVGPRIMLVEEAGQVLEAHVLGSLVPSIQHLILIGDPLQLRPTINNYGLSMDHKRGGMIYKFDMSLMERLATSGLPMSQIDVQRRMRPSVANLVRKTLYPKLQDHEVVKNYPPVRGMAKSVFFLSHSHRENGGEDESVSKYNQFEVDMAVDLVMHLLRQGPYSSEGDIVVLCGYLGQLARMRDAFADKVAVVIDERDQVELADREAEKDDYDIETSLVPVVDRVKVTRRVLLRTIDNFQGEEAKIVILSLVRNSGGSDEDDIAGSSNTTRANIGFLKSENRTNVALSRAREGLYIMGNAANLAARSKMWESVLTELEKEDCVGDALPIVCQQHGDVTQYVSKPGQLPRIAPDGGCLRQCDARLKCGHLCPYKCHSDDPKHSAVVCDQRCTRLCPRGHPCTKSCADECGKCNTRVSNVELPCGHTKASVPCYQLDLLSDVECDVMLTKQLPDCEHQARMKCSDDPSLVNCTIVCDGIMACCGRNCQARCHQCQTLNVRQAGNAEQPNGAIARTSHAQHRCERRLYCEHQCDRPCSAEHECTTVCKAPCRQVCPHARCNQYCSTPCAPCQEPCTWNCPHYSCPLPCGSICARLPCDVRCTKILRCGHRCPSVCGEDCSIQICPACASEDRKSDIVDLVLQRSLEYIDPDQETLDELLITIPSCKHVFTVETLDGHCGASYRLPKASYLSYVSISHHVSKALQEVIRKISTITTTTLGGRVKDEAKNPNLKISSARMQDVGKRQKAQRSLLRETRTVPLPWKALDPSNEELHDIAAVETRAWRQGVNVLLNAYRDAASIANMRSSHTHAWEASFSYLYQKEMDAIAQNPANAPRNPHEYVMRLARLGVGQAPPRADRRFHVEAFWTTITIRLNLVEATAKWIEALTSRQKFPKQNGRLWELYTIFILKTCAQDATVALKVASESESHRQVIKTTLLILRIELEQFRLNVDSMRRSGQFSDRRLELSARADKKNEEAEETIRNVSQQYLMSARRTEKGEADWLHDNFTIPSNTVAEEWGKLAISLRLGTFYEPLSLEEMSDIVKGLNFSHAGHFYKCPNGHTFVITECGGANQVSRCPECGAQIGGSGHRLIESNTRDTEFETLAATYGAARNPWAI